MARYTKTFNMTPSLYAITAYDAALVIADAIKRVAASGQPVNRDTVRDAMQQSPRSTTLQGPVSFDENGDITTKVISVWQIHHDAPNPEDDVAAPVQVHRRGAGGAGELRIRSVERRPGTRP